MPPRALNKAETTRLALLHPDTRRKVFWAWQACIAELASVGPYADRITFWIGETRRAAARQMQLYAKGRRFEDGVWSVVDRSRVVTRARPWESAHCMTPAEAAHIVPSRSLQTPWEYPRKSDSDFEAFGRPLYVAMGERIKRFGLVWGGDWSFEDFHHCESVDWGRRSSEQRAKIRRMYV